MSTPPYPSTQPGPIESSAVAQLLIGYGAGKPLDIMGAYLLTWDPVTRENTVARGVQSYTDLDCLFPTLLSVGPVLLLRLPARPIIIGRLYSAEPAP